MVSVSQHVMVCKHREVSRNCGDHYPRHTRDTCSSFACTNCVVGWKVNLVNVDGELSFVTCIGKEWTVDFLQLTVFKGGRSHRDVSTHSEALRLVARFSAILKFWFLLNPEESILDVWVVLKVRHD